MKERQDIKEYNDKREHVGINGLASSHIRSVSTRSHIRTNTKQEGVTYGGYLKIPFIVVLQLVNPNESKR
jgi:hypothetical protein